MLQYRNLSCSEVLNENWCLDIIWTLVSDLTTVWNPFRSIYGSLFHIYHVFFRRHQPFDWQPQRPIRFPTSRHYEPGFYCVTQLRCTVHRDYRASYEQCRDVTCPNQGCFITSIPNRVTFYVCRFTTSQVALKWHSNPPLLPPALHLTAHELWHWCRPERAPRTKGVLLKYTLHCYYEIDALGPTVRSAHRHQWNPFLRLNESGWFYRCWKRKERVNSARAIRKRSIYI